MSFLQHLHCEKGNYIKTIYTEKESELHDHVVNVPLISLRVNGLLSGGSEGWEGGLEGESQHSG